MSVLIDNSLISLKEKTDNWKRAFEIAGHLLLKSNLIKICYLEAMKQVGSEFGP